MFITVGQLVAFMLILARLAGLFLQAPVLSSRSIPALARTALAVWLATVFWFVVPLNQTLPTTFVSLIVALVSEVVLGFLLGFIANLILIAVQSAGEIMDLQMGLSVATALDPMFGATISIVGRLAYSLALVLFVTLNGHHLLLVAIHQSFRIIPAGVPINIFNPALQEQLMNLGVNLWTVAIILSAPAVLLIFLSDFCFGIVSRVAPQVNVFMLGFQVKPSLGLLALLLSIPFVIKYIANLVALMGEEMLRLILIMKF